MMIIIWCPTEGVKVCKGQVDEVAGLFDTEPAEDGGSGIDRCALHYFCVPSRDAPWATRAAEGLRLLCRSWSWAEAHAAEAGLHMAAYAGVVAGPKLMQPKRVLTKVVLLGPCSRSWAARGRLRAWTSSSRTS